MHWFSSWSAWAQVTGSASYAKRIAVWSMLSRLSFPEAEVRWSLGFQIFTEEHCQWKNEGKQCEEKKSNCDAGLTWPQLTYLLRALEEFCLAECPLLGPNHQAFRPCGCLRKKTLDKSLSAAEPTLKCWQLESSCRLLSLQPKSKIFLEEECTWCLYTSTPSIHLSDFILFSTITSRIPAFPHHSTCRSLKPPAFYFHAFTLPHPGSPLLCLSQQTQPSSLVLQISSF